jgi:hypothetical protein
VIIITAANADTDVPVGKFAIRENAPVTQTGQSVEPLVMTCSMINQTAEHAVTFVPVRNSALLESAHVRVFKLDVEMYVKTCRQTR